MFLLEQNPNASPEQRKQSFQKWRKWLDNVMKQKDPMEQKNIARQLPVASFPYKQPPKAALKESSPGFEGYWGSKPKQESPKDRNDLLRSGNMKGFIPASQALGMAIDRAKSPKDKNDQLRSGNMKGFIPASQALGMAIDRAKSIASGNYYPPPWKATTTTGTTTKITEQSAEPSQGDVSQMAAQIMAKNPFEKQPDIMANSQPNYAENQYQQYPDFSGNQQGYGQTGPYQQYHDDMGTPRGYQSPKSYQDYGNAMGPPQMQNQGNTYQEYPEVMGNYQGNPNQQPYQHNAAMSGPQEVNGMLNYNGQYSQQPPQTLRTTGNQEQMSSIYQQQPPHILRTNDDQERYASKPVSFAKQDFAQIMEPLTTPAPIKMLSKIPPYAPGSSGEQRWRQKMGYRNDPSWPKNVRDVRNVA
ncbi:hypothetical protein evm_001502 [Chilo suppressalis]|nr:hypothetical protein evm_001502 [Chilo suppressalis]